MTATAEDANTLSAAYSGLDTPDTNYATWINHYDVEDHEMWDSTTDWHKTKKRTYYHHLDEQNRGRKNGPKRRNDPFITYLCNRHLILAMADSLELTMRQKGKAEWWFRRLDLQKLGRPSELAAYCLCARIVHEDGRDVRKCHPAVSENTLPSEFREVRGLLKRVNEIHSLYGVIDNLIRSWEAGRNIPSVEEMDKYKITDSLISHQSELETPENEY